MNIRNREMRAVLFDLDGVLVPTEPLKGAAHAATIGHFGGSVSPYLYNSLIGQHHEAVREAFIKASGLSIDPETYTHIYRETYHELLQTDLKTTPGAVELVRQLAARKYTLAVVSSTAKRTLQMILSSTGLAPFFSVFVASDDVTEKKPAPDAYALALDLLNVAPRFAIAVEDSETGIKAAHDAGVRVVALRNSFNINHDFSKADAIVDSLIDNKHIIQTIHHLLNSDRS